MSKKNFWIWWLLKTPSTAFQPNINFCSCFTSFCKKWTSTKRFWRLILKTTKFVSKSLIRKWKNKFRNLALKSWLKLKFTWSISFNRFCSEAIIKMSAIIWLKNICKMFHLTNFCCTLQQCHFLDKCKRCWPRRIVKIWKRLCKKKLCSTFRKTNTSFWRKILEI